MQYWVANSVVILFYAIVGLVMMMAYTPQRAYLSHFHLALNHALKYLPTYPTAYSTPEYRIPQACKQPPSHSFNKLMASANFIGANLCLIDGMRVDYSDGWGLMRTSNTSPDLTFRFEAESEHRLESIKALFRRLLGDAGIKADLPF